MTRLDGKVALVTGAGGGLGAEHAKLLAKLGAKAFEQAAGLVEQSPCVAYAPPSTCAEFQRDHLDDFVAWYGETYQG